MGKQDQQQLLLGKQAVNNQEVTQNQLTTWWLVYHRKPSSTKVPSCFLCGSSNNKGVDSPRFLPATQERIQRELENQFNYNHVKCVRNKTEHFE